jgi:hypothetical protein
MRTGEVLETVPSLIVTQHSGSGKANQYFLRGFNPDHGTDFRTEVDGFAVNMPSTVIFPRPELRESSSSSLLRARSRRSKQEVSVSSGE